MRIYSVKNEKLDFFNRPMYFESSNECLAYLMNVLQSDADRALIGLKNDLSLYDLGEIDFITGFIKSNKRPFLVTTLSSLFDSIPEDRIPQTANELRDRISKIEEVIKNVQIS